MDVLQIPFGTAGETLDVIQEDWFGEDAVAFNLPQDGRIVTREHIAGLIEWLQGFMEETKPQLPTLPHATIKAKVQRRGEGPVEGRVLTYVEPVEEQAWVSYDEGTSADWFTDEDIVSFEVLFPGVEA